MITCLPMGICSWDFRLLGPGWEGATRIHFLSEQGSLLVDGSSYEVRKHGPFHGEWSLRAGGQAVMWARKSNAFQRTFALQEGGSSAELRAVSCFTRSMTLVGPGLAATIEPVHAFTRRAHISGQLGNVPMACFAFWLTLVTWRRAASSHGGGGGTS